MTLTRAPDLLLVNGRVATLAAGGTTPPEVEALAVRGGRIVALGDTADLRELAGPGTVMVDLGGRRVIPGLCDSHVHFVRAGLTWNDEIRWEDVRDLGAGLRLIGEAAAARPRGSWIRVIGGWHPDQLPERRGPSREELDRVAPHHPVLVQNQYRWGLLNTLGAQAIGLTAEKAESLSAGAPYAQAAPTGSVRGIAALRWLYAQLPAPSPDEQVASTIALSRELARRGITALIDGGGVNTGPDAYHAVFRAARAGGLTTRVRLTMHASGPGAEREEYEGYLRHVHPLVGDEFLRVLGLGEIVVYAIHDSAERAVDLSPDALGLLRWTCGEFAARGWPLQIHTCRPETVEAVLDCWEATDRVHPIRGLRWALVHAECLTATMIERLRLLGAGVLTPSLFRFEGDDMLNLLGAGPMASTPPLREILTAGVPFGAGTDAMRVASYQPFDALQWYVTGRTMTGRPTRDEAHLLTREEALRAYTLGGAWFSFEEGQRGSLEPGKIADLVVLDRDYFAVPAGEIGSLQVGLTLLGGRVAWASDAFAGLPVETVGQQDGGGAPSADEPAGGKT